MNIRRLTPPLLMAFAVSGLCTFALSRKMSSRTVQQVALLSYVAPVRTLQAGEVIKLESLKTIPWPAANPIAGAFTRPESLMGRALLYPVDAEQPITERLVSAPGAGMGLAGRIPDGMRAIALRSDEVMGVAGFVLPGSHLDVLVTYHTDRTPEPQTFTVLQDAEVIAAGHQIQPDPEGKPAPVDVVTLLLTPPDAERAVLASTQGTIHFVLRSGSDKVRTHVDGIGLSQLSGGALLPAVPTSAPSRKDRVPVLDPKVPGHPKPVHQHTVETISGDKQVNATFDEVSK